ncbi:low-density lipoprotein receptor class A domain-containing protein 1 isoform X2 [Cervus canadensis]|uniref:low-density lipoprotein receptor class A domain-containing protein 1 isoform X2 n=1 Tax=Cervus canadensis TaxID=1574408 RepID=UPI001C9E348D|nr:low-density lipoprotein receptor class A domain-containing protein 1 isoform X2 [Cervus canadensis]XP_043317179.1 low-density lipoprotein receptor class A domain-containing protein 1 isoform X2 [Cervus canadensis]
MNKILPQGDANSNAAAGSKALPGGEADCSPCCYSRRGVCLSAFLMLLLTTLAALIALVAILGPPSRTPGAQACVTQMNRTGFLCNDRSSCIPASRVCDGVRTCAHGEDEEEALCRAVPQSLPGFLVAHCGDPASWIYSDQMCDGINNCGDCSDELSPAVSPGASAGIMCSIAPTGPMSTPVLALD